MQFLDNRSRFFLPNCWIYRERFFHNPWKFHRNVFSEITAFTIFSVFQNFAEKWTVNCNVQRSTLLNSLSQSMFEISTRTFKFHTSSKSFLWSSVCPCQLSPAAIARLFSSLYTIVLWIGMKCFVVFMHNSPDVTAKRVTAWRVWRPFFLLINSL